MNCTTIQTGEDNAVSFQLTSTLLDDERSEHVDPDIGEQRSLLYAILRKIGHQLNFSLSAEHTTLDTFGYRVPYE